MPVVASKEVLAVTSSWLEAFVLLAAAHTAAWASGYLLRNRLAAPIDGGLKLMDGRRLLGDHKTWRGLIAAVLTCAVASALLGRSIRLGLSFGMWSMSGDAASSFLKRRLRLAPGASIPGLDQVPEALTPLVALSGSLGIGVRDACALTALFVLTDLAVSPIRRRLSADQPPVRFARIAAAPAATRFHVPSPRQARTRRGR